MNIGVRNQPVADNIESIIKEKGLKQGVVAQRAGFSIQQFCDMLNGRRIIRPCDVSAIAKALGVDAGALFRLRGEAVS